MFNLWLDVYARNEDLMRLQVMTAIISMEIL